MKLKAGEYIRPADYKTGVLEMGVAVRKDSSYILYTDSNVTFPPGEIVCSYDLIFVDVIHYEANIGENYKMTDIREWEVTDGSTTKPISSPVDITPEDIAKIQQRFDKWYTNNLTVVDAKQGENSVKISVKIPVFYSYNVEANTIKTITPDYAVGDDGITFTAPASGVVVISEGKFTKESQ